MYDMYDMYHTYQYDKQSDHYCRKVGNDHETTVGHQMAASLYNMTKKMMKKMSIYMTKKMFKYMVIIITICVY